MRLPSDLSLLKTTALSTKEIQVLQLAADGLDSAGIAEELETTTQVVKNLAYRACIKIGADSRCHAVAVGFRKGILR